MSAPAPLTLVSHVLCPYVQRAAIVLREKGLPFDRRWVDLGDRPDWFSAISPLGKTPVLLVDGQPLFESAVICEYLDEAHGPRMHPQEPFERARHRGWMEVGSALLDAVWRFYTAPDAASLQAQREALERLFARLEQAVAPDGPFFAGERFSLVDAVFAPVFRYFDTFEAAGEPDFFGSVPRVQAWRQQLARRSSVREAVVPDYAARLLDYLRSRGSELSRRIAA